MTDYTTIIYALVGGILPAIIWLLFWLEEDRQRPEPRKLIAQTFLLGMCATVLVIPLEKLVANVLPGEGASAFFMWAILEEALKFFAAYIALRSKEDNEPLDPLIYMIVAALGFVALENTLFIANPLLIQNLTGGVLTADLRFIGASLLHVVSSATIGAALALSFFKSKAVQTTYLWTGFLLAVIFHTTFNLFIIHQAQEYTLATFGVVWFGVILLFLLFEKVKAIAVK